MEVVEVVQQPPPSCMRDEHYTLVEKRLEVVAYSKENGTFEAAAKYGYHPASVLRWWKKEAAYVKELFV